MNLAALKLESIRALVVFGAVLTLVAALPAQAQQIALATVVPHINVIITGGSDRSHDSRGTGFLVGRDTWVTAAHVVSGCSAVYVKVGSEWRPASNVKTHAVADLAVFSARQDDRTKPLPISDRTPVAGDAAIHVGFAKGEFTAVGTHLSASANVRMASTGGVSTGFVWAQEQGGDRRMNGVSGGPQLDARGAVQGVTISYGNSSNGMRMTTAPISELQGFLPATAQKAPEGFEGFAVTPVNPNQLRANGSVTSVLCATPASTRNQPRT